MNQEAQRRLEVAEDISEKLRPYAMGTVLIGSVAYAPEAVTPQSDIDMVSVMEFSRINFKDVYKALRLPFDERTAGYANQGRANSLDLHHHREFDVSLFLWDVSAMNTVANASGYVRMFRPPRETPFTSEALISLRGKILEGRRSPNNRESVEGGLILKLHPVYVGDSDVYTSVMANVWMRPRILIDSKNYMSRQIETFKRNLRQKLRDVYGKGPRRGVSLINTLPEKVQKKLSPDFEEELTRFF
jgi:hypothetical protein